MEIELLNGGLLSALHEKALVNEQLRQNYDLRTTPEDGRGAWHSIEVLEPSCIFEAKDGAYGK